MGKLRGDVPEEELFFSALYGGGVYRWNGMRAQDPFVGFGREAVQLPVFVNVHTGEEYAVKVSSARWQSVVRAGKQVLNPSPGSVVMWPVDVIDIGDDDRLTNEAPFVGNEYTDKPDSCAQLVRRQVSGGTIALLFAYGECPNVEGAEARFSRMAGKGWKDPKLREAVVELCRAVQRINNAGYVYGDVDLSRFFFKEDGTVCLAFTDLIFSTTESPCCCPGEGEYPLEFAEPAYACGVIQHMDYRSQCYGICSLAFKLLFGRHAYDGRMLVGYGEDTLQNRYMKYKMYHKIPVFIFEDSIGQDNSIGMFDEDSADAELWDEAPGQVRHFFLQALSRRSAMREGEPSAPGGGSFGFALPELIALLESVEWD